MRGASGRLVFGSFYFALAVALLSATGCRDRPVSAFKIGALIANDGLSKSGGDQAHTALDLARKATGLDIVEGNTGSDPAQAVRELRRLIEVEKVPVVVAAVSSDEILECALIANRAKVVLIATIASSEDIRSAGDYVFRTTGTGAGEAKVLATRVFSDLARGRVATVHSSRAFGISYRDAFVSSLVALGGAIPRTYSFPDGTFDFRAIVNALKAEPPDGIFITGGGREVGLFVRQVRAAGLSSRLYAAGVLSAETYRLAGEAAEGLIVVDSVWNPASSEAEPRSFVEKFRQASGVTPDYAAASTYDAVGMVARTLRDGARTGGEIQNRLIELRGFRGVQGDLAFDADGEVNLGAALLEVRGGELVRLRQ